MNRFLRVLLALAITIASAVVDPELFGKTPPHATTFAAGFLLFLPVCILLFPIALYFDRLNVRRSFILAISGALIGATVVGSEILFHLTHAKHLPYPSGDWYYHEPFYLAAGTAIACLAYALIFGTVERRLLASNQRHDR